MSSLLRAPVITASSAEDVATAKDAVPGWGGVHLDLLFAYAVFALSNLSALAPTAEPAAGPLVMFTLSLPGPIAP